MAALAQAAAVAAPTAALAAGSSSTRGSGSRALVLKAPMFAGRNEFSLKTVSNGSRVSCMKVWTPIGNPKFETLSYLPPLSPNQISRQIDYMLRKGWVPCLEFDMGGIVYREHNNSPGYYDGRYWTMWKLPMFGCNNSAQVLNEIEEAKRAYPDAYIRVLGFDNVRQVQCAGFLVHKPGQ